MTGYSDTAQKRTLFRNPAISGFALLGFCLAVLSALAAILSGLGTRWGWWDLRSGITMLRWGGYGSLAAVAVSLVGCLVARPGGRRRGYWVAIPGLLLSLVIVSWLLPLRQLARRMPVIHDITTDMENPPRFVAILPLRKDAPNPPAYGGPDIAALQRAAYPDIAPATFSDPPAKAFDRALAAARAMGWDMVASVATEGRIEAIATTFWFGFKDDIIVRVTPAPGGSRIDVRSVSRVGKGDVGTNARRIRNYLAELKKAQ